MKNFFYFLLGLQLLLTGCNSSQKHDMEKAYCNSNLDSIKVVYFKYRFFIYSKQAAKCSWQTVMNIPNAKCQYTRSFVKDTMIRDCDQLKEIESELTKLHPQKGLPDSLDYLDARMAILVYKKNGIRDSITVNDLALNTIYKNRVMQNKNNRLVYLIRKYTGYYSWFPKDELQHAAELKDTTFNRDSIEITLENNPLTEEL